MSSITSGGNLAHYGEAWWWQHHAVGMFSSSRDWETSQDRGKNEWAKYREILDENPASECSGPQTWVKVHLPTGQ
jgi:hypothetical protein